MDTKMRRRLGQLHVVSKPFYRGFAKLTLLMLAVQATFLLMPYFTGRWLDAIVREDTTMLVRCIVAIGCVLIAMKVIEMFIALTHINETSTDVEIHIGDVTLSNVLKFSVGQVTNQNSGFKQDTLKKGEAAISELLNTLFMEAIPLVIRMLVTVMALYLINMYIGFAVTVCMACFTAVSITINTKLMPRVRKNRRLENKLSIAYWELIRHLRLVMVSGQEKRARREYSEGYSIYGKENKDIWSTYVKQLTYKREPFAFVGQLLVLSIASYLALMKEVSYGDLLIITAWASNAFGALNSIGSMQRRLVRNFVILGRYFDLLEIPPAVTVTENAIRPERYRGKIEFKDVRFNYPEFKLDGDDEESVESANADGKPAALKDVSFLIEPGEVCAFVGPSGSGKSTAVNLILRGYDVDSGQVMIDGHDVRALDYRHWRKSIGIVEQDPKLWDNTLGYNIVYGLNGHGTHVSGEMLEAIAKKAKIDEFYHRLGGKRFETIIGENGIQLSGGQRQRVAIARALIREPSLLILDEATNALDPANEKLVHEAIRKAMEGRTGIIIAHRLSTIRHADKIIVFDKGTIAGIGKHAELLENCRSYRELVLCEIGTLEV